MRDFTWQMFEITGDLDAYLLYRGACHCSQMDDGTSTELALEDVRDEQNDTPLQ